MVFPKVYLTVSHIKAKAILETHVLMGLQGYCNNHVLKAYLYKPKK